MEGIQNTFDRLFDTLIANKFPYTGDLIHVFVGGSGLHGGRVGNTHDDDFYGIFIEPPNKVIGLHNYPHYVWSSAGDSERNKAGDIDICLYSLRKWVGLATGGNPTCLGFLFTPETNMAALRGNAWVKHHAWQTIRDNRKLLLSKSCINAFEGFAKHQLERVMGTRGLGKHGQRPELEERYGYDVKAAMHVVRLLCEGIELLMFGTITYPRPERDLLIAIRSGQFEKEAIQVKADDLFARLKATWSTSVLPEKVDEEAVSDLIVKIYLRHWQENGYIPSRF
jgi:uncharacterized protein